MPIYEYRCSACGHELAECPSCHAATLVKLVSAAGFQLKGSGWYVTDFRGGGAKPSTKSESSAKSGNGDSKSESTSESKSESKTETKSEPAASTKPAASTSGADGS